MLLGIAIDLRRIGRVAQGQRIFGNLCLINIAKTIQWQCCVVLLEAQFLSKLTGDHITRFIQIPDKEKMDECNVQLNSTGGIRHELVVVDIEQKTQ